MPDYRQFGKYARPEIERKYLLPSRPATAVHYAELTDFYLPHGHLRLRQSVEAKRSRYKLGHKIRPDAAEPDVVLHTNIYLNQQEFDLLCQLPTQRLRKTRFTQDFAGRTMLIDEFRDELEGLVMAEIDFALPADSPTVIPQGAIAEVTADERFSGGRLAQTSSSQLKQLLREFAK